jgi:hypothetical protein
MSARPQRTLFAGSIGTSGANDLESRVDPPVVVRVRSESRAALFDLSFRAGSPREEVRYRFATLDRRIRTLTARYR